MSEELEEEERQYYHVRNLNNLNYANASTLNQNDSAAKKDDHQLPYTISSTLLSFEQATDDVEDTTQLQEESNKYMYIR